MGVVTLCIIAHLWLALVASLQWGHCNTAGTSRDRLSVGDQLCATIHACSTALEFTDTGPMANLERIAALWVAVVIFGGHAHLAGIQCVQFHSSSHLLRRAGACGFGSGWVWQE